MAFYFTNAGAELWNPGGIQTTTDNNNTGAGTVLFRAARLGNIVANVWRGVPDNFDVSHTDASTYEHDADKITILKEGLYYIAVNSSSTDTTVTGKAHFIRLTRDSENTTIASEGVGLFTNITQKYQNTYCVVYLQANDQISFYFQNSYSPMPSTHLNSVIILKI